MRLLLVLAVVAFAFADTAFAQVKTPDPVPVLAPFSRALQLVVVTTNDWNEVPGTARLFERTRANAHWKAVGARFPVVVGRNGLALAEAANFPVPVSFADMPFKKEGDGRSPAGLFPLTAAFGTAANPGQIKLSYTKLDEYTECVDDVRSTFYNRIVNRVQVGNFDWNSSEKMLEVGPEYELGLVVGYNSFPVTKGSGSCIFLHIRNPYLVQMPAEMFERYRRPWKLPKIK
jgi:L,D-peptidoglycan transpeptidase YkuD (ErfK/YbiS/YcfS/YnhG family)